MHYPSVHRAWFLFCPALIILAQSHRLVAQETGRGPQVTENGVRMELTNVLAQLAAGAERVTMGGRMGSAGDSLPDVVYLCRAERVARNARTSARSRSVGR